MSFLTADDWDLIVDALVRMAENHLQAAESLARSALDARRHKLKKEYAERAALSDGQKAQGTKMRALAKKISQAAVDEIVGTQPGDEPDWAKSLRAMLKAKKEAGL